MFGKSLLSSEAEVFAKLTIENKEVSSAKILTSGKTSGSLCGKSLI